MNDSLAISMEPPGKALRIGLWVAQVVLAIIFIGSGLTKLLTPIAQLATMMPWTGDHSEAFVRFIGCVDLAGGLGIMLPSLSRILPRLTVFAASGIVLLQILALCFHLLRGEAVMTPLNIILLILAFFVLWGRNKRVPITPRG